MIALHTAAEVRAAEEPLLAAGPEGALMQQAATGLATVSARLLHGVYGRRVALLVGTGNNGGDALFAGAQLARRGARVAAVLLDPERAHAAGLSALRRDGGRVLPVGGAEALDWIARADLVLDGMLGIGGRGGLRPDAADLARAAADGAGVTVAIDVPSGVDASTGAVDGPAFPAMHTVTFGAVKLGLVVGEGRGYAGEVHLIDIGLDPHLPPATAFRSPTPTWPHDWFRRRPVTTSTRRASWASLRARRPIPARACSAPAPRCRDLRPGPLRRARRRRGRAGRLARR